MQHAACSMQHRYWAPYLGEHAPWLDGMHLLLMSGNPTHCEYHASCKPHSCTAGLTPCLYLLVLHLLVLHLLVLHLLVLHLLITIYGGDPTPTVADSMIPGIDNGSGQAHTHSCPTTPTHACAHQLPLSYKVPEAAVRLLAVRPRGVVGV